MCYFLLKYLANNFNNAVKPKKTKIKIAQIENEARKNSIINVR